MSRDAAIEAEVQGLQALNLGGLRTAWLDRVGDPPSLRSADLVRHMLAWRIQAEAYGGLDKATRQALARTGVATRAGLAPGTRISREWRGVAHEVEVTEAGYRYAGETYPSLSAIARKVTGSRWNGWRFFGLADPAKAAGQ